MRSGLSFRSALRRFGMFTRFLFGIAGFVIAVLLFQSCDSRPADEVASVGRFSVSEAEFRAAFKRYYNRTGQAIPINPTTRNSVLAGIINKYATVEFAEGKGWHNDSEGKKNLSLIERKVLIEEYQRRFITSRVRVEEADMREIFRRMNTIVRASHIWAPHKPAIDSLYKLLQNGKEFEVIVYPKAAHILQLPGNKSWKAPDSYWSDLMKWFQRVEIIEPHATGDDGR